MTEKAIEVSGLCKSYGDKKVLDNVTFSIDKGSMVGFLGPNGAGKSTTMNIITGYISPDGGSIKICGIDMFENPLEWNCQYMYSHKIH
ncbi:MAG: ATP-binding cassette domain-containing protein [Clostridia bacterium]|nr:ATP-binding cassette domain-containing protein [Clostridia bacterium]